MLVHPRLDFSRDGARRLVEDSISGSVVEEASHGDALLIAAREGVSPLTLHVPAAFALDEAFDRYDGHVAEEIFVGDAASSHLGHGVGVDDLVAEGAEGAARMGMRG